MPLIRPERSRLRDLSPVTIGIAVVLVAGPIATFGVLRDMLTESVPDQLKPQLTDVMNNFTSKLGGRVFQDDRWWHPCV